jgi:2'-5' RNA ligase
MTDPSERPRKLRTFVAIGLPEPLRLEIGSRLAALLVPPKTPIALDRLHITLHFLGPTLPEQFPAIESALASVAKTRRPFELLLEGVGAFPDERAPEAIWLGVSGQIERLVQLAGEVGRALDPLGFPPSPRPFRAHLTLSRTKLAPDGVRLLASLRPVFVDPVGPFDVDQMALFRSETLPEGPRYTEIARFALGQRSLQRAP